MDAPSAKEVQGNVSAVTGLRMLCAKAKQAGGEDLADFA
jgi:hypothetical protein